MASEKIPALKIRDEGVSFECTDAVMVHRDDNAKVIGMHDLETVGIFAYVCHSCSATHLTLAMPGIAADVSMRFNPEDAEKIAAALMSPIPLPQKNRYKN